MKFDLHEVIASIHGMASGVLERLPYVGVAIVVYALFHLAARIVRRLVTRLTRRQRKHRNVGFVVSLR